MFWIIAKTKEDAIKEAIEKYRIAAKAFNTYIKS